MKDIQEDTNAPLTVEKSKGRLVFFLEKHVVQRLKNEQKFE